MDSNMKKQALYEIYSACRLCGSSSGYKIPIVQNIIPVDGVLLELPQKIKECVNIEVHLNDKMPPLICEPCIVKVNNIHNFRQLCKRTHESTRLQLQGLPLQATPKDAVVNDKILAEKEQIHSNNHSNGEPAGRNKKFKKAKTENTEPEVNLKIEKDALPQKPKSDLSKSQNVKPARRSRLTVSPPREKTPPRMTRQKITDNDDMTLSKLIDKSHPRSTRRDDANDEVSLSKLKDKSPPRSTRRVTTSDTNDDISLSKLAEQSKKSKPPPKPVNKRENDIKKEGQPPQGIKRYSRELQQLLATPPVKKIRETDDQLPTISTKPSSRTTSRSSPKPAVPQKANTPSKSSNVPEKSTNSQKRNAQNETKTPRETNPPRKSIPVKETNPPVKDTNRLKRGLNPPQKKTNPPVSEKSTPANDAPKEAATERICFVCDITFRIPRDRASHMRKHHVSYTPSNKACNACREWFTSAWDAQKHHNEHRDRQTPYRCMLCSTDFTTNDSYERHITKNECRVSTEVPDVKCEKCWKYFPTMPLLNDHNCWGEGDRPAMCIICNGTVSARNLKKHEKVCTPKKGLLDSALVDQDILDRLKPMQVRVARCDPLLKITEHGHFNVATVRNPYGLDRHFFYPYVSVIPKTKIQTGPITPFNSTFKSNDNAKREFDYVHWDSDSDDCKNMSSLKSLCLKVIYSHKVLGKVPKRLRLDDDGTDDNIDFNINIDSLIDQLNDIDERVKASENVEGGIENKIATPKTGGARRYSSPWNNSDDYNSDSIINDVFRGFSLSSKEQSDDSQSLVIKTMKDLLKSNGTDESVMIGESKGKELNHCNDAKTSQINLEIEQRTDKLEATEYNSSNINSLSVIECANNDFKTFNTETKSRDDLQNTSDNSQSSFDKDLGTDKVVSDTEHLEENYEHNANADLKAEDNGYKDTIDVLESKVESNSNIITLEMNKDNTFLYNEKYKEARSTTSCSDDCNPSEDILKTIVNENGATNRNLRPQCEGVKDDNNAIVNVCENLDINEHVDNVNGNDLLFNQSISDVNKSVHCESISTSELISASLKENCENLCIVKDSADCNNIVNSDGQFVSDSIESITGNKDVSDSTDIFKKLNERIALINQNQINNSTLVANVSEFPNNEFRTNISIVNSDLSVSYVSNDKVQHVNDKVHHDIDKVHHQNDNVYNNNVNLHHGSLVDNVGPINDYNKENLDEKGKNVDEPHGNDKVVEKELADMLKLRDAELEGMDLDNISDDDFNFD